MEGGTRGGVGALVGVRVLVEVSLLLALNPWTEP